MHNGTATDHSPSSLLLLNPIKPSFSFLEVYYLPVAANTVRKVNRTGNSTWSKYLSLVVHRPRQESVLSSWRSRFESEFRSKVRMFCGGSFRCKPGERNDEYRLVRRDNVQIRVLRSASVNHGDAFGRRVFAVPDKVPEGVGKARICLQRNSGNVSFG